MNKIFCVACGHKNIYEVTKPKFCAGCGEGIGGSTSASAAEKVSRPKMEVELGGEDEVGSFDLRKLRSQVVAESTSNKITLGDIMGSNSSDSADEFKRKASDLPDGQAILEQSKKDCGTSKPSDIDG